MARTYEAAAYRIGDSYAGTGWQNIADQIRAHDYHSAEPQVGLMGKVNKTNSDKSPENVSVTFSGGKSWATPQECLVVTECVEGTCPIGIVQLRGGMSERGDGPGTEPGTRRIKVGKHTLTTNNMAQKEGEAVANKGVSLSITRKEGKTMFSFAIAPEIEAIYQQNTEGVKTSAKWAGLEFYTNEMLRKTEAYKQSLERFHLFDDYGQSFYREGRMNIAWMRTVGGTGTITLTDTISFAELSVLVNNVIAFTKEYFEDYFREFVISGNLEVTMPPQAEKPAEVAA